MKNSSVNCLGLKLPIANKIEFLEIIEAIIANLFENAIVHD